MRLLLSALLVASAVLAAGCSSVRYNPTAYDFYIDKEALAAKPIKKVVLASVNVSGEPTRSMLRDSVEKIDAEVSDYLRKNGYTIAPSHVFKNAWQQALLTYGDFYDPTSGRVDQRGWQQVMAATMNALQQSDIDAIVFTDLIEHEVQHSGGLNHYARWYGVTREPATEGSSASVAADFNWNQLIKAASLVITVYSPEGKPLFTSRGGLDTLYAINNRKSNKSFVRRSKILTRSSYIEEGIELAFHPLIVMDNYPGLTAEQGKQDPQ